jgi:hypothetical protein
MKKALYSFAVGFALLLASCQQEPLVDSSTVNLEQQAVLSSSSINGTCPADTFKIFAGQTINVGNLIVSNDAINLYVRYEITNTSYYINQAHLWVGVDPTLVPKTANGTPIPGQFPYKVENLDPSTTVYTFTIPLKDVIVDMTTYCDKVVYLYAHAALEGVPGSGVSGETAWSDGTPFGGPRWGWYSTYTICCQTTPPPVEYTNETAFAKFAKTDGGYVFTTNKKSNPENYPSLSLTQNRWGWAGNLAIGQYTAPIYAGAGLNNISNGTLVGTLSVNAIAGKVTVTYQMNGTYKIGEVHIYVGDSKPTTLAPGQYGFTEYFDPKASSFTQDFFVNDTNGDGKIWIIAHAVACIPVL